MAKWKCSMCGYVYDEEKGESSTDTEPGTKFGDLPDDWICPICGASKDAFELLGEEKEEEELTTEMKHDKEPISQWKCSVCGYVYDQKAGEPATNTPPSTRFGDLPEDWKCPICGSGKEVFEPQRDEEVHAMVKTTVSDVLISELEAWGVKLVFGIPGTSSLGLVEAVRKNKNMRFIVFRHEENAALAASAYNKFTGKMAACLTIAGPGATNLSTGLYDAKEDGASVISLNGQVEMQYTGPYGFQEIDQDAFFRPVSVYNKTIYDKNATVLLLTKALKFALLQKGVAQLSVPNNVQKELLNVKYCRKETCITNFHIIPHDDELKKAVRAIDESKMPVIIAGWGAYEDGNIVLDLAQKIKAPILTTYRSKGILPDDNEWMMGILGYVGSPQARKLVNESDLLITFGVGFSKFTNVPTNKPMVQLDINPLKLGKSPYGIPLWGNCSLTTPKLLEKVQLREDDSILQKIETMKSEWYELLDREADSKKVPSRPPFIMKILSETIPDDAMISVDCGENQWWFGRNFKMKRQRFTMSCYLATMGFGLPGAIAAKLAYPHKTVFCITGDGGFSMAMADFVTAVKYDLPMVVVVLNNKQLAMIQVEQMMEHYSNFATDLLNPNFADYAETCGGVGIKVKRPDELKAAIEKAKTINKPVIVDVDTDPKRFSS